MQMVFRGDKGKENNNWVLCIVMPDGGFATVLLSPNPLHCQSHPNQSISNVSY